MIDCSDFNGDVIRKWDRNENNSITIQFDPGTVNHVCLLPSPHQFAFTMFKLGNVATVSKELAIIKQHVTRDSTLGSSSSVQEKSLLSDRVAEEKRIRFPVSYNSHALE